MTPLRCELAARLGVTERTLRRWVARGWRIGDRPPRVRPDRLSRALEAMGDGAWTGARLGAALGKSERAGSRVLRDLIEAGMVEPAGWARGGTPLWRAVRR